MPDAPLLTFYGDDFTGSTDVMEALASHGIPTVLFTRIPSTEHYCPFKDYRAVGLAGTSRSQTPAWMEENLRPAFRWLKGLGAGICHYKVCSTFDSSPTIGSIGKAIYIGRETFGQRMVPLVVGAPQLGRYTVFGHLFASYQGGVYRIDRHPVMRVHPVTPMTEADLLVHLAQQTDMPMALVSAEAIVRSDADERINSVLKDTGGIILLDVMNEATQLAAGQQLLRLAIQHGPFVAGSSGIEFALVRAWMKSGAARGHAEFDGIARMDRIGVFSGSCSPTTERQIRYALERGFDGVGIDPLALVSGDVGDALPRYTAQALAVLARGRSVIVHTALGGASDRSRDLDRVEGARHRIGQAIGLIAREVIVGAGLKRAIFAGGDTSSHAVGELDIHALTTRYPLKFTPGSPLCIAHSGIPELDGMEIALKGGQVGNDDYFVFLRDGQALAHITSCDTL